MAANFFTFRNGITLTSLASDPGTLATGDFWFNSTLNAFRFHIAGSTSSLLLSNTLTANTALVTDGSSIVSSSAVTATELGYLSGVTSSVQTQLTGKVAKAGDTMTGNLYFSSGAILIGSNSNPNAWSQRNAANVNSGATLFGVANTNSGSGAYAFIRLENDTDVGGVIARNSSTNTAFAGANSLNLGTATAAPLGFFTDNVLRGQFTTSGLFQISQAIALNPLASAPSSPVNGTVYYDSVINRLRAYNASAWTSLIPDISVVYAGDFAGSDLGAQINAADTSLGASPGKIIVPSGNYTITTQIVLQNQNRVLVFGQGTYTFNVSASNGANALIINNSYIIVQGAGKFQTILKNGVISKDDVIRAARNNSPGSYQNYIGGGAVLLTNVQVRDLTVDGNQGNITAFGTDTYCNGINLNYVTESSVENCLVQNVYYIGIVISNGDGIGSNTNCVIRNNEVTTCGEIGIINGAGYFGTIISQNTIHDLIADAGTSRYGVGIQYAADGLTPPAQSGGFIHGNNLYNIPKEGITLGGSINFTNITDNVIRNVAAHGGGAIGVTHFSTTYVNNSSIANNIIDRVQNPAIAAIYIQGPAGGTTTVGYLLISNNVITNSQGGGISQSSDASCVFSANHIFNVGLGAGSSTSGIEINGSNCKVSGNYIDTTPSYCVAIDSTATNTLVSDNYFRNATTASVVDSGTGSLISNNYDGTYNLQATFAGVTRTDNAKAILIKNANSGVAGNSPGGYNGWLTIQNTNSTTGNASTLAFANATGNISSLIYGSHTDQTNNYGTLNLLTRGSDGYNNRLAISNTTVAVLPTTVSTSSTTGSATFAGGVGIAGALFIAGALNAGLTVSRAVVTDGSSNFAVSATTSTELGFVSGVTSAIQTQLNAKEPTQTKGSISTTTTGVSIGSGANSTVGPSVTVNIATASGSTTGLLTSTDWTTFNSKGSGTVTSVSVVSANGFAGTSSGGATPALTLTTTVTGILSGNGTAITGLSTTGSGNVVLATSPTLVTPALGTPTALVGTNITGTAASFTAGTVTTNANLTGPITSVGNATSIASQTGTGSTFAMSASPTFTGTVNAGAISAVTQVTARADNAGPTQLVKAVSTGTGIGGYQGILQLQNTDTTVNNLIPITFLDGAGSAATAFYTTVTDQTNHYGSFSFLTRAADGYLPRMSISNAGVGYLGGTSGVVTVAVQATAGTYNFNLPTTAGTAGQVLTSQGGGSTAMTWSTVGTGTVTSVSVVTANGLAGTSSGGATPALTLSTTITGILQGNGTAISAATTTGSGSVVLATSPTLVTPALGTPSALVGTNITGTASGFTAGTVTTNANLTGPITSSGNATVIASQTGAGSTFVMSASPSITGTLTAVTLTASGVATFTNATASSSTSTGGAIFSGGVGIAGAVYAASFNGVLNSAGRTGAVRTATTTTTLTAADDSVLLDMTSGAFTATLPAASAGKQAVFMIKIDSGGNAATIAAAGADTINGAASVTLGAQYDTIELWSDGVSKWFGLRAVVANSANAIVRRDVNFGIQASGATIAGTTASTSKTTGAITTAGGIGVAKNVTAAGFLMAGATSGFLTHLAGTTTTSYTLNWPSAQGGSNTVLLNDGSGNLTWNTSTGTGNVAFSASPTFTGTLAAATVTASGVITSNAAGAAINVSSSNASAYNSININNTSSAGFAQANFSIGAAGANGQATIGYAPGIFFLVGPTASDTTTPLQLVTNNGTVGLSISSASVVSMPGDHTSGGSVSTSGYDTSSPATGATVTTSAHKPGLLLTPATTLATLTIKLPPTPTDGQQYWIASSQAVTAVTFQDAGGTAGNVIGSPAGLTTGGLRFVYNTSGTKWYSIA